MTSVHHLKKGKNVRFKNKSQLFSLTKTQLVTIFLLKKQQQEN